MKQINYNQHPLTNFDEERIFAYVNTNPYLCDETLIKKHMDIGENIKFILKVRKLNQTELAQILGVSKRTVQYYTTGNVSVDTLSKIAEALDTTVETLVSETPLYLKLDPIPTRTRMTDTKLVCPHCGEEITIMAK